MEPQPGKRRRCEELEARADRRQRIRLGDLRRHVLVVAAELERGAELDADRIAVEQACTRSSRCCGRARGPPGARSSRRSRRSARPAARARAETRRARPRCRRRTAAGPSRDRSAAAPVYRPSGTARRARSASSRDRPGSAARRRAARDTAASARRAACLTRSRRGRCTRATRARCRTPSGSSGHAANRISEDSGSRQARPALPRRSWDDRGGSTQQRTRPAGSARTTRPRAPGSRGAPA